MSDFKSKHRRYSIMEHILRKRCKKPLKVFNLDSIGDRMEYVIEKEKPDVIISFFAHVTVQLLFCRRYDIPVLQMYHTHPKLYHQEAPIWKKKSKELAILFNYCLRKVSGLQLFFHSYAEFMKPYYSGKIRIIHNPVKIPMEQVDLSHKKKKLIYLSRIDKNKGQDSLIEAFALIANSYPDWVVELWGDCEPPEYRGVINNLISKYGLERQIKLMGVTKNPVEAFMQADIGVYPSSFEGFPLGLSEALAIGLPCIGFEVAVGINELIKDRQNGLLAEYNQIDLARKLAELMNNPPLRIKYGQKARDSVKQYSEELFWAKWEAFIDEAVCERRQK